MKKNIRAGALSDRCRDRGPEADGKEETGHDPHNAGNGCKRKGIAARAAALKRLQGLADGFAIVVGGATGDARFLDRCEALPIIARPGVE
jgi:hypothetical protein